MTSRINPKFTRYGLRVGRSPIHRYGVFAFEEIPRGRLVIEYTGRRLSSEQAGKIDFPKDAYLATSASGGWLTRALAEAAPTSSIIPAIRTWAGGGFGVICSTVAGGKFEWAKG
jgi:hypothetical protein